MHDKNFKVVREKDDNHSRSWIDDQGKYTQTQVKIVIISILKSLVIPAILLALRSVIY